MIPNYAFLLSEITAGTMEVYSRLPTNGPGKLNTTEFSSVAFNSVSAGVPAMNYRALSICC